MSSTAPLLGTPSASQAFTIASLTASATEGPARASRVGPAPLITQPQAPASRAASRTARPPWISPQR